MKKHYITPEQLLQDAFNLAWQVFASGFRPDLVVGIWRGGAPVAIAMHELLLVLGVEAHHAGIQTRSYTGIAQRDQQVRVDGLEQVSERIVAGTAVLLVDDVYDTGLSLQQVLAGLGEASGHHAPDIRIATPYFKPANNRTGRTPDYYLHEGDDWLVFPHELAGLDLAEMRANKPELADLIDRLTPLLE